MTEEGKQAQTFRFSSNFSVSCCALEAYMLIDHAPAADVSCIPHYSLSLSLSPVVSTQPIKVLNAQNKSVSSSCFKCLYIAFMGWFI